MKTIITTLFYLALWIVFTPKLYAQTIPPGVTDHGRPSGIPLAVLTVKNDLVVDHENNFWICTHPIGPFPSILAKWDHENWEVFTTENSPFTADTIYDLFSFGEALFIGTSRGVAIYNGDWEIIDNANGSLLNHVYSIFADSQSLYLGTNNGLFIIEDGNWTHYTTSNSAICNDTIQVLTQDLSGKLWIGTRNGLCSLHENIWTNYNNANSGLSGNDIRALLVDSNNHLWVGLNGNGGLNKMVGETFFSVYDLFNIPVSPVNRVISLGKSDNNEVYVGLRLASDRYALGIIKDDHIAMYNILTNAAHINIYDGQVWYVSNTAIYRNLYSFDPSLGMMLDGINKISVNNISADFTSTGRLAWDMNMHNDPHFEIPKGSGKYTVFTQTMWIAGLSDENNLHLAAERYGQIGRDYSPGPISASTDIYQQEQEKWNKVWKISKTEIDYHRANLEDPGYEIPESIQNWPAHGDTLLGQDYFIAPYMDLNSNGIYEPHLGDYPMMRGDEALFFVYNDHRYTHTETGGEILGVEIRGMAYAFDNPTNPDLDHTLFINYQVINRSETTYDSVYLALFTDFDIGMNLDDYIGCDTALHAYFGYNATPFDGTGQPWAYGEHPPAQGVVFLNNPLSTFIYFNNVTAGAQPYQTDPDVAIDYYNYIKAIWKDGTPMVYGGNGHPSAGGTGERVWHMFPGTPGNPDEWNETSANNPPNDRRGLGSTYIGTFEPGQRICFDKALVFGRDMDGNNLSSVSLMKERISRIIDFYNDNFNNECFDLTATGISELQQTTSQFLKCYPNPFAAQFTVEYAPKSGHADYYLYNTIGELIASSRIVAGVTRIPMHIHKPGLYILVVRDGDTVLNQKLIKQ